MRKIIILTFLLAASLSFAAGKTEKKAAAKKPVAANSDSQKNEVILKVTYGDKISEFRVAKNNKGGTLKFASNSEKNKEHSLSEKDMTYISSEIKSIEAASSNDPSLCSRRQIELTAANKKTIGCLGSPTKTAKKLTDLANLFSTIVKL